MLADRGLHKAINTILRSRRFRQMKKKKKKTPLCEGEGGIVAVHFDTGDTRIGEDSLSLRGRKPLRASEYQSTRIEQTDRQTDEPDTLS